MPPEVNLEKCNGCGICDIHCPVDVIFLNKERKKAEIRYPEECWHCGVCRMDCPPKAVEIRFPLEML